MIDKYQQFFKLSKTEQCSIYSAVSRQNNHPVLLKRFINKELTWDQILKCKNMQFSQRSKMFPKMIQIFKSKTDYYIVYERPNGNSLHQINKIGKMLLQDFYILFDDLVSYVKELKSMLPTLYIVPEWIFMHRNTIKLIHFQPFFLGKQMINSDHVYLYKIDNQLINPESQSAQISPNNQWFNCLVTSNHRKNMIYTLAIIAYYLITGTQKKQSQTQAQYQPFLTEIQQNAQRIVTKITKDKVLGHMIGKMLTSNLFQMPDIDKIYNFIHRKALQVIPKKKMHSSGIHIQFQRLKLQSSRIDNRQHQLRRRLRHCCEQKQASIQRINEQNRKWRQNRQQFKLFQNSRTKEPEQLRKSYKISIKKANLLPSIQKKCHGRIKTQVEIMNTTSSKPLMFGSGASRIKYG